MDMERSYEIDHVIVNVHTEYVVETEDEVNRLLNQIIKLYVQEVYHLKNE